jgi:hypothetical protein
MEATVIEGLAVSSVLVRVISQEPRGEPGCFLCLVCICAGFILLEISPAGQRDNTLFTLSV